MKTSLYLIILLTALYSLLFLSCGKDNPDDEIQDPWTLVLEEYIGAGGGVIDTGGIRFEIPAGMFGQSQRIQLYSTDESAFGSNQATLLYEIRGLPESLDGIIPFRVKTNKTLNDKFYLAAGSIQYAKSTGDTVYFMTYFPATDSSGYVVGNIRFRDPLKSAISVGRSTDELEPGLESIHQGKISITVPGGMEEITTSLSHFKVFYTVPDVPVEMATYLGESLEDALEKFHSLGFSNLSFLDTYERYPIQVTFRPYNKCIGVNRKDYGSCASPGICENVNPHFDFNYNKMSDANTIAIISGHECFHMVQYCYKTTGESKNWLTEATATYTEEFFTTQPGGYIPITFTSQWYRPLVGMEAGAKFADPEQGASSSYHGYGMSAIVKYFIEHAKVEQPLKKMIESLHNNQSPVDAVFSVVPGEDFSSIWELAMADYVSKTTYPMPLLNRSFIAGELYYSLNWAKSVTLKANETTFPSVSYDLPDLSATFTNINLEGNFHPGQELYLEITSSGDPGHIHYPRYYYIYKSGTVETP